MTPDFIRELVQCHDGGHNGLISVLEEIQSKFGYLPMWVLKVVSEETLRSLVDIYGVATFYKNFSLEPKGEHLVCVCSGTACHVKTSPLVVEEFERQLNIKAGSTTADQKFTLETVNCLGACAQGPVVVVDGKYYPEVTIPQVSVIVEKTLNASTSDLTSDSCFFPVQVACSRCNHSLMDDEVFIEGFPSIRVTFSSGHDHGPLRLSSVYGSHKVHFEGDFDMKIPEDSILQLFCPHCHTELIGATDCPECGIKMVPLFIKGGGTVQICPRTNCRGHLLDVV